ncbi:MAG: hypothetical protein ACJBCI_04775 [Candidatus Tisiphia sp.]
MGRINNGNWVNQHRKIQGKFQNKQDIAAYLFDKKLSNGNNIQENNRLNTDDLPNIPALLANEPNLSRQSIIEPIDGGKAHTTATQAFLSVLTTLSVISPNITASSKKYISTDSQNSLSHTVKSFTEVSQTPVLFDTTSATTPTRQNHDRLEEPIKDHDNQSLIRVKRAGDQYFQLDCLHVDRLDTEFIKRQLKENSNFTGVCLTNPWDFDSQKAQDFATILKNININVLVIPPSHFFTGALSELKPSTLNYLSHNNYQHIQEIIKVFKDNNVEKLILSHNYIVDKEAIYIIKSLKEVGSKVKILDLTNNMISNKGAEDIAPELRGAKIVAVQLQNNSDIKPETLQKISMVLEDNKHVNEDSYTSTMESSTTKASEPIAKDIVTDSTTPTPKESNPNNPASSTMSIGEPVGLIALAVSIIGAIGGAVIYVTQKFYDGKKSYTHDDLPLAESISGSHLDNNKDIPLTGVVVDEGI